VPKVICDWSACIHNDSKRRSVSGECSFDGIIELCDGGDVFDYDDEKVETLQCDQFKSDYHKFIEEVKLREED
jgi:hypothetical protein